MRLRPKVNKKNRRLNRYQAMPGQYARRTAELHGEGTYIFRNITSGDLMLTKAANDGRKSIPSKCEWEGDNYFMKHMKCGEASMVRTIETPEQEKVRKAEEEKTLLESRETMSEKLILDQPDQVTVEGTVEQVVTVDAEVTLSETKDDQPQKDVLLNEDPLEGVEIILE